jgi:hypothetical protein
MELTIWRLLTRAGLGSFLVYSERLFNRIGSDLDSLDIAPFPCRPVDVPGVESIVANSVCLLLCHQFICHVEINKSTLLGYENKYFQMK